MIDNTRAKTGYDVELLVGSRYFLAVIKAALATGKFPPTTMPIAVGSLTFEVMDVTQTTINDENQENIEEARRIRDLSIWFDMRLTFNKNQEDGSTQTSVHDTFMVMEVDVGVKSGRINLTSWKMEKESRIRLNEIGRAESGGTLDLLVMTFFNKMPSDSMAANVGPQNIRHMALKKLNSTPECQAAIGLYLNMDLDLNEYCENALARYLKRRFPFQDLTTWETGAEVLEFIKQHNNPKDAHGNPVPQLWPLRPELEMDVPYFADRWHVDHLNILPEYRPQDSMGAILIPDEFYGFVVQDWHHSTYDPAEILAGAENSIYARILGNTRFGGLELDPVNHHTVVKDASDQALTGEEVYQLYLKNPLRGNLDGAENYLPLYADFIVGINPSVLGRFGMNTWNLMKAGNPKKAPPFYDEHGFKVGKYNHLTLSWGEQRIKIDSNLTYFINNYPDASVDVIAVMNPTITGANSLAWDAEVTKVDVDTGILSDILGGLTLGLLGALGFLGGALLGVGLVLGGAAAGVGIVEGVESVVASSAKKKAQEALQSQTGDLFNLLPAINGMFPRLLNDEACYCEMYGVSHCFKEFNIGETGMALGGWAEKGMYYVPLDARIIGRARIPLPDTDSEVLCSLRYRNQYSVESDVMINELAARLEDGRLKKTKLVPEAVRRGRRRIDHIRFTSGVDLRPEEVMDLMDWGVVEVQGYTVVHMKSGTRYLRNIPDKETGNNLSEMKTFKP
ncbi:MAG TPA: hypothetical protein DCR97_09665 [Deltaproteobacteria bacterium]|nr:hypothetical protein [Deltaproteobacteria bacterium]